MRDLLLIAGIGYLAYHLINQPQTAGSGVPVAASVSAMPVVPGTPATHANPVHGIAIGEPLFGGGGGDPLKPDNSNISPVAYWPSNYDPFSDPFFSGGSSGPTYRQQYPLPPGVIDVGGGHDGEFHVET